MPEIKSEDFVRLATLFVPETANAIAFSPDGSLLAVAAADKVFIFQVPPQARVIPIDTGEDVGYREL